MGTPFLSKNIKNEFISFAGNKILILFSNNKMKLNTDIYYILIHMQEHYVLKTGYFNLKNSYYEKLLGINCNWKLKFPLQIGDICKEEPHKLNG